jgi:hypothetical protein
MADVSRDSISSYERGVREAHPGTGKKLANALEVDVKSLVDMEKIEVEVRWEDSDGRPVDEKLRFTGELVDTYENDSGIFELYECPGGYRVLVHTSSPIGMSSELHPNRVDRLTGELEYDLYSAREVVQIYPQFGEAVGVVRVRDID